MGRKHTDDSRAKISATRKARYGVDENEKRRKAKERYERWAAANPERISAIKRRSYEKSREALNARQREINKTPTRKAFMRDYAPKHRAANPDKYRTYAHKRRAAEKNAPGAHTDEQWLKVVCSFGGGCAYCGAKGVHLTRDHDIPLVRGGSNNIENIVPACRSCNSSKGTLTGDEFKARKRGEAASMDKRWSEQLAAARKNSPSHRFITTKENKYEMQQV